MVANGRPRGGVDFGIQYDAATEAFTYEFVLPQAENANRPTNVVAGTLTPASWDGAGPVSFEYTLHSALKCTTGDVTVSWAGIGSRVPR